METTLLQRNVPKAQLSRGFGARALLLPGSSPLGLATGSTPVAFTPSTTVIVRSAIACILVSVGGLVTPAFRCLSLSAVDHKSLSSIKFLKEVPDD